MMGGMPGYRIEDTSTAVLVLVGVCQRRLSNTGAAAQQTKNLKYQR